MISDDDRAWLTSLNDDLWPSGHKNGVVSLEPSRVLTESEFERMTALFEKKVVVLEMITTNMFGGYGVRVYEHAPYPGTGPMPLACFIEGHLPPARSRYDRDIDKPAGPDRRPGEGSTRAWRYFSAYTHTEEMRGFCKRYGLEAPHGRSHYDY